MRLVKSISAVLAVAFFFMISAEPTDGNQLNLLLISIIVFINSAL